MRECKECASKYGKIILVGGPEKTLSQNIHSFVAATVNWQLSHIGSGDSDNAGHVPGRTLFLNIFFYHFSTCNYVLV